MSEEANIDKVVAEANYRNAQAEFFRAQTAGQVIDNRTAQALAASAEIALAREQLKDTWDGASNTRHRVCNFTDNISGDSVEFAVDMLARWSRIDNKEGNYEPYHFVICSGGGSVVHGMKLFTSLKKIAAERGLITVASGVCASMATVIHQAGTKRLIEPGCSYMIHDVSGDTSGTISTMQDTMAWFKKLNETLHTILAERSTLSLAEVAALGERRDSWFMPEEVVAHGLADEIGYATV